MRNHLSSNIEDYLETIVILSNENKAVRVKDISKKLEVSMPSVHSALHVLKEQKLINHEKYGYVELTKKGKMLGEKIYEVHKKLTEFLNKVLNIDTKIAELDACRLEHGVSPQTIERLILFLEFLNTNQNSKLISEFIKFIKKKKK